ncbi:MAG: glycosyltransferase family 1 protein [Actinomycetota bacterium]
MRVAANLSFLLPGVVGGSEEYSVRLLRAVLEHHDDVALDVVAHDTFFEAHPALEHRAARVAGPVRFRPYRVVAESVVVPRHTRSADVTHHFGGRIPSRATSPAVVTIHDIQPLDLPQNFSSAKQFFLRRSLPDTARRADLVCTPTQWVADRVVDRLGISEDRVRVIGPALGRRPVPSERDTLASLVGERPLILFPSVTHPHKNHQVLIDAMARVHQHCPDALLVFTGGAGAASADVAAAIARVDPASAFIRHLGRVDEQILMGLLADADLVVYPSRYEGFGLPVLEAMHAGTPVIAADAACLPEVAGDAGILLPVDDTERWATEILALLDDPDARAKLAAAGSVRAEMWAAADASARLVEAWREVAS